MVSCLLSSMDRAIGFYPIGWGFESLRGHNERANLSQCLSEKFYSRYDYALRLDCNSLPWTAGMWDRLVGSDLVERLGRLSVSKVYASLAQPGRAGAS